MAQLENEMLNELSVAQGFTNDLAANLTAKGVPSNTSEGLDTLVPKVLQIESGGSIEHTDILYADLLALINNDELIPNSSYRITNYKTTTVQADTTSAGHDFDIIVTALSTKSCPAEVVSA